MKFGIGKLFLLDNSYYYYVCIESNNEEIVSIGKITKLLGIPTQELIEHFKKFNGIEFPVSDRNNYIYSDYYIFKKINQASKTAAFLNEEYGVLLKLMG